MIIPNTFRVILLIVAIEQKNGNNIVTLRQMNLSRAVQEFAVYFGLFRSPSMDGQRKLNSLTHFLKRFLQMVHYLSLPRFKQIKLTLTVY